MSKRMIKVMQLKAHSEKLEVIEVEAGYKTSQKLVGGRIDRVSLPDKIDLWVNDEFLLHDLPFNFHSYVVDHEKEKVNHIHTIMGDVFFASYDEEGDTISLSESQIKKIREMFNFNRRALLVI